MLRVTAQWTGFQGAPGYSNFYFGDPAVPSDAGATANAQRVRAFFNGFSGNLPNGVTIAVQPNVSQIDPGNGTLLNEFAADPGGSVVGSGTGPFAAPAGACITWLTIGVVAGKRLRGRTFIVPIKGEAFQTDGTLSGDVLGQLNGAADALRVVNSGGSPLGVWHRPVGGAGGVWAATSGHKITDKAAILTSRRD